MKYYTWLIVEILLIAALISACFPKDFKTVHPEFIYGGISDNGKYDFEVKNSIVTKELIPCTKFKINRALNADYTLRIYYYNSNYELVKINEFNGEKLEVGYLEMPKDADYIRIAISNFAGFSAWDRFRFWLWDLGLEVSTTEQFFLITWFEDVFGSNESEVDPTAPTDSFPDMIYPGGAMVM